MSRHNILEKLQRDHAEVLAQLQAALARIAELESTLARKTK